MMELNVVVDAGGSIWPIGQTNKYGLRRLSDLDLFAIWPIGHICTLKLLMTSNQGRWNAHHVASCAKQQ